MRRLLRRLGPVRSQILAGLALGALILGLALMLPRVVPDAAPAEHQAQTDAIPGPGNAPETPDARLERLITTKIEGEAPGDLQAWSKPSFQLYHGLSDDELRDLRRDPTAVVDRLLRTIAGDGEETRRQKVLRALEIYLDETEGSELPGRFVTQGVGMLASAKLPIRIETDLASALARRARVIGMNEADRASFRTRARVVLHTKLPHPDYAKIWAWSLAQLGGPEDKEIVLGAWDVLDRNGRSKILETGLVKANDRTN
jgi:hypothetical protein